MKAEALSRRDFLRHSGLVATGLATVGTIIFGTDYAWALSTSALDPHTAETLMVMARQLFPHDRLGEQYYAVVVDAVDKQAAGDAALRKQWRPQRRAEVSGDQRVLLLHALGDDQQPLHQPASLSLLRLRGLFR